MVSQLLVMRVVLAFCYLAILTSCSKKPESTYGQNTYGLEGQTVELDSALDDILDPYELFFMDTLVVAFNWGFFPRTFALIDVKNHNVLGTFGRYGEGPGGIVANFFPYQVKCKRSIGITGTGFGGIINVDSILASSRLYYTTSIQTQSSKLDRYDFIHPDSVQPISFWNINDSLFLADGLFQDGRRLGLYGRNGELLSTFFSYPDSINSVNPRLKAFTFNHLFATHPTKDLFVNVYTESDWVEILELKDKILTPVYSNYTYLPEYEVFNEITTRKLKTNRLGNIDVDVTDNLILVLRTNNTVGESIRGNRLFWSGTDIIVYDWNGYQVGSLQLDREIEKFCISENDHAMYAYVRDPKPALVVYELPTEIFELQ